MTDIFKQVRAIALAISNTNVLYHAWLQTGKPALRAWAVVAYDRNVDAALAAANQQKEIQDDNSTD